MGQQRQGGDILDSVLHVVSQYWGVAKGKDKKTKNKTQERRSPELEQAYLLYLINIAEGVKKLFFSYPWCFLLPLYPVLSFSVTCALGGDVTMSHRS